APGDQLVIRLVGKTETWRVVIVDRVDYTTVHAIDSRECGSTPQGQPRDLQGRRDGRIEVGQHVISVREWTLVFPAKPQIQRELPRKLPIVLKEYRVVDLLLLVARLGGETAGRRGAQLERRQTISGGRARRI